LPEVIQELQDTEEMSPPITEPEKIAEPVEDIEMKMDSEGTQEVIPSDFAQQTGVPQADMELVQEPKDVFEPPKENVSSKKTEEPRAKNNQPEVIQEPRYAEEMFPPIEKISEHTLDKKTEILPKKVQQEIVIIIEMEPVSKHARGLSTIRPLTCHRRRVTRTSTRTRRCQHNRSGITGISSN